MKSQDLRTSFLDYFRERGHTPVPSAPLVPHGDPTLLFVNAGMVPFKGAFLGDEEPPANRRAVSAQKCLRVSGKHNDLENVGPSPRHHTFFEMLGNFSFGDYFKEDAIRFAWELVTEVWGLPVEHLYATVFETDDEAFGLWEKLSSLPEGRILRCGAKDNFWAMGETGPCGPCSEIHIDLDPGSPAVGWEEGTESGRYLEIWNLVFMQYDRDEAGELRPLPRPSIDTGAGLERLAAVLQKGASNYDTDLFLPLLEATAELAGVRVPSAEAAAAGGPARDRQVALRVVADHLRAVTFLLADGVIPGNEGRGYVLRRLLRRAVRHGMRLGLEEPFLHRLVPVVGETMGTATGSAYEELAATREASVATVQAEEDKFLGTLATGSRQVETELEAARERGLEALPGEAAFRLYDTYGLPVEVIREIAEEERMGFDEAGFEAEMKQQRERSRAATGGGQKHFAALARALRTDGDGSDDTEAATPFEGYRRLELEGAQVRRLATAKGEGDTVLAATSLEAGQSGVASLDRTVFYAESGGQVGDTGRFTWGEGGEDGGSARVTDTKKDASGLILHFVTVEEGTLTVGDRVRLAVDPDRRAATERNHTATHLLHAALREVLGTGVRQAGSLVAPDRLRFDFTLGRPMTEEEVRRVETLANRWVLEAHSTEIEEMGYQEAVAAGAMALFGEKYGDRVRTVQVPEVSMELCGGCHVGNTGAIGPVVVTAERGIASGVRRIEALTGFGALEHLQGRSRLLDRVAEALGSPAEKAPEEVESLKATVKERDAELSKLRMELVSGAASGGGAAAEESREVAGIPLRVQEVPPVPTNELRTMADTLRSKQGTGVVVIGARGDGKVSLVVAVSDDLVDKIKAGDLVRRLAPLVGGGGGGRPDFAMAGGKEPDQLPEALEAVPGLVEELVS